LIELRAKQRFISRDESKSLMLSTEDDDRLDWCRNPEMTTETDGTVHWYVGETMLSIQ